MTRVPEALAEPEIREEGEASVPDQTAAVTLCVEIVSAGASSETNSKTSATVAPEYFAGKSCLEDILAERKQHSEGKGGHGFAVS